MRRKTQNNYCHFQLDKCKMKEGIPPLSYFEVRMKYLRFLLILMFPALVYAQSVSVTNLRLNSAGNSSKNFASGSFDTTFNAQAFSVHRNAVGQVIPTGGSGTQIDWTTEEFDTNNVFNLSTESATLTEGYWSLCLAVTFNSCTDTGVARAIIRKKQFFNCTA